MSICLWSFPVLIDNLDDAPLESLEYYRKNYSATHMQLQQTPQIHETQLLWLFLQKHSLF